jgi:hypothetical protein
MREIAISAGVVVVTMLMAAPVSTIFAQGPPQGAPLPGPPPIVRAPGETPVAGKCLFKEDLDLIAAHRARTRTTLNNDAPSPFGTIVGRWTFEYDVPESALAGGQIPRPWRRFSMWMMPVRGLTGQGPDRRSRQVDDRLRPGRALHGRPGAHSFGGLSARSGRPAEDSGGYFTHIGRRRRSRSNARRSD